MENEVSNEIEDKARSEAENVQENEEEAFFETCCVCGVKILEGEACFASSLGTVAEEVEGFIATDTEPWLDVMCKPCRFLVIDEIVKISTKIHEFTRQMENLSEEDQVMPDTVIWNEDKGFWTGEMFSLMFEEAKVVTRMIDLRKESQRAKVIAMPVFAVENCGFIEGEREEEAPEPFKDEGRKETYFHFDAFYEIGP